MTNRRPRLPEIDTLTDLVQRVTRLERHSPGTLNNDGEFDPTVVGDLISSNWDGAKYPALDLSTQSDPTATQGFAGDASAGSWQFEGVVYAKDFRILDTQGNGPVRAMDVLFDSSRWVAQPLGATMASQTTVSLTIPSWAQTLYILTSQWVQLPGDADQGYSELACRINIDGDNGFVVTHGIAPDGTPTLNEPTMIVSHTRAEITTTWSNPLVVVQQARRYAGPSETTQTATHGELSATIFALR